MGDAHRSSLIGAHGLGLKVEGSLKEGQTEEVIHQNVPDPPVYRFN